MTVKKDGNIDLNSIVKEFKYLKTHEVQIGFFASEGSILISVVRANEYGTTITPHNNSNRLWVPSREAIKKYGKNVKPKDVQDLFVAGSKKSAGITKNGKYVVMFYLLSKVKIPSRPFLRTAFYQNQAKYKRLVKVGIDEIIYDGKTGKDLLTKLGKTGVSDVRQSMKMWTKPGNAPLTIDNKMGTNNPLVDTGNLIKHVTYKIARIHK